MAKSVKTAREEQKALEALHRLDEECVHHQRANDYLRAFDCMERALVLRRHFFGLESEEVAQACRALAEMCNLLAMSFLQQDNYPVTIDLLKKAEVLTQQHGTRFAAERATTLNNLACYYRRLGKLHAAMTSLRSAVTIEKRLGRVANAADTLLNLCAVLSQLGKHDQALVHAQEALVTLQEDIFRPENKASPSLDRVSVMCIAYHNVGVEQEFLKAYDDSVQSYKKGVGLAEQYLGPEHSVTITIRNSYLAAKRSLSTKPRSNRQRECDPYTASPSKGARRLLSSPRDKVGDPGSPTSLLRMPSPLSKEKQKQNMSAAIPTPRSIIADALSRKSLPPLSATDSREEAKKTKKNSEPLTPTDPFFSPRYRFPTDEDDDATKSISTEPVGKEKAKKSRAQSASRKRTGTKSTAQGENRRSVTFAGAQHQDGEEMNHDRNDILPDNLVVHSSDNATPTIPTEEIVPSLPEEEPQVTNELFVDDSVIPDGVSSSYEPVRPAASESECMLSENEVNRGLTNPEADLSYIEDGETHQEKLAMEENRQEDLSEPSDIYDNSEKAQGEEQYSQSVIAVAGVEGLDNVELVVAIETFIDDSEADAVERNESIEPDPNPAETSPSEETMPDNAPVIDEVHGLDANTFEEINATPSFVDDTDLATVLFSSEAPNNGIEDTAEIMAVSVTGEGPHPAFDVQETRHNEQGPFVASGYGEEQSANEWENSGSLHEHDSVETYYHGDEAVITEISLSDDLQDRSYAEGYSDEQRIQAPMVHENHPNEDEELSGKLDGVDNSSSDDLGAEAAECIESAVANYSDENHFTYDATHTFEEGHGTTSDGPVEVNQAPIEDAGSDEISDISSPHNADDGDDADSMITDDHHSALESNSDQAEDSAEHAEEILAERTDIQATYEESAVDQGGDPAP